MRFFRVMTPFLFVRNWYTGRWELSRPRLILFVAALALFLVAIFIILALQAPVEYSVA